MEQRSWFNRSPNRNVTAFRLREDAMAGQANCAQSEPNASADMQSIRLRLTAAMAVHGRLAVALGHVWCRTEALAGQASARECSSPSSIFVGMLSPGLITLSSNQTFSPSARNRSASGRTTALSFALWLSTVSGHSN